MAPGARGNGTSNGHGPDTALADGDRAATDRGAAAPPPQTDTGDAPPAAPGWRWTPTRIVVTVVVGARVAMWAVVLLLAVGPGRPPPSARLDA